MSANADRPAWCTWPTAVAVVAVAAAVVALVWLSPSLRVVAGPVEIVHTQPPMPRPCEAVAAVRGT